MEDFTMFQKVSGASLKFPSERLEEYLSLYSASALSKDNGRRKRRDSRV